MYCIYFSNIKELRKEGLIGNAFRREAQLWMDIFLTGNVRKTLQNAHTLSNLKVSMGRYCSLRCASSRTVQRIRYASGIWVWLMTGTSGWTGRWCTGWAVGFTSGRYGHHLLRFLSATLRADKSFFILRRKNQTLENIFTFFASEFINGHVFSILQGFFYHGFKPLSKLRGIIPSAVSRQGRDLTYNSVPYGYACGIISLTLRSLFHSLSASVIKFESHNKICRN